RRKSPSSLRPERPTVFRLQLHRPHRLQPLADRPHRLLLAQGSRPGARRERMGRLAATLSPETRPRPFLRSVDLRLGPRRPAPRTPSLEPPRPEFPHPPPPALNPAGFGTRNSELGTRN